MRWPGASVPPHLPHEVTVAAVPAPGQGRAWESHASGPHLTSLSWGTLIIIEQRHGPLGFPLVPCQEEDQTGCPGRRGNSSCGISSSPSPLAGGPLGLLIFL